jgi:hypothetical protein
MMAATTSSMPFVSAIAYACCAAAGAGIRNSKLGCLAKNKAEIFEHQGQGKVRMKPMLGLANSFVVITIPL